MRIKLRQARVEKGLTQQQVADELYLSLRQYQRIENGDAQGSIETWDKLEDMFTVPQRRLREIAESHHVREDSL